jgi:hypothetical protein
MTTVIKTLEVPKTRIRVLPCFGYRSRSCSACRTIWSRSQHSPALKINLSLPEKRVIDLPVQVDDHIQQLVDERLGKWSVPPASRRARSAVELRSPNTESFV